MNNLVSFFPQKWVEAANLGPFPSVINTSATVWSHTLMAAVDDGGGDGAPDAERLGCEANSDRPSLSSPLGIVP